MTTLAMIWENVKLQLWRSKRRPETDLRIPMPKCEQLTRRDIEQQREMHGV